MTWALLPAVAQRGKKGRLRESPCVQMAVGVVLIVQSRAAAQWLARPSAEAEEDNGDD
jgi:hypothetical protein